MAKLPWHKRTTAVTLSLFGCITLSLFGFSKLTFSEADEGGKRSISVRIEHPGFGPRHIESSITVPLEDRLAPIPGIAEIRSVSEYGSSFVSCVLRNNAAYRTTSLQISGAVDLVYGGLPASVRPPKIYTSGGSASAGPGKPVSIITFAPQDSPAAVPPGEKLDRVRHYVEEEIQPALLKLEGTGRIDIGGGTAKEIAVGIDGEKSAGAEISIAEAARQIQLQQLFSSGGGIVSGEKQLDITISGKGTDTADLEELDILLPGGERRKLKTVAEISYRNRELPSIAKSNGREHVAVYVYGNGAVPLPALSKAVRDALAETGTPGMEYSILYDAGDTVRASLLQVTRAVLWAAVIVILLYCFSAGSLRLSIIVPLFLLLVIGTAAAALSLLSVPIDHYILASFALGIGMVLDIGIIIGEHLDRRRPGERRPLREIRGPLVSSVITTLAVLVPLLWSGSSIPGGRQSAVGITVLSLAALGTGFLFLPCYCSLPARAAAGGGRRLPLPQFFRLHRTVYLCVRTACRRRGSIFLLYLLICICGTCIIITADTDFTPLREHDRIFSRAEFEPGASLASVDTRMDRLAAGLLGTAGIEKISTLAKPGSGELNVHFQDRTISKESVVSLLSAAARRVPGCFLYTAEPAAREERVIELIISGPRNEKLREIAETTAAAFGKQTWVRQTVLHFKAPPPAYVFIPYRETCLMENRSVLSIAKTLWRQLHGPVVIKLQQPDGEIDVRLFGGGEPAGSKEELGTVPVPDSRGTYAPVSRYGTFTEKPAEAKIYRRNRQRSVYLSIHSAGMGIGALLRAAGDTAAGVPMPKEYFIEIDKNLYEERQRIRKAVLLVLLAVLIIYMVLASQFESFFYPLLVMAVIPAALSFPLLWVLISGGGITVAVLIGSVLLCGSVVNNGILIVSRFTASAEKSFLSLLLAVRHRSKTLLLTSGTSIAGALPVLFLTGYGSGFMKTVAWVFVLGSAGAVITSFTLTPALLSFVLTRRKRPRP